MKFQIKSYGLDERKLTSWAWHDGSSWRSATSWRPLRDEHIKRLLTKNISAKRKVGQNRVHSTHHIVSW